MVNELSENIFWVTSQVFQVSFCTFWNLVHTELFIFFSLQSHIFLSGKIERKGMQLYIGFSFSD